jgi:hypothetical protein
MSVLESISIEPDMLRLPWGENMVASVRTIGLLFLLVLFVSCSSSVELSKDDFADDDSTTAVVDDDAGNDDSGLPIPCRSSKDCADVQQVCHPNQQVCVECIDERDCAYGSICLADKCVKADPCDSSKDCTNQVCAVDLGYCVDCLSDADCGPGG